MKSSPRLFVVSIFGLLFAAAAAAQAPAPAQPGAVSPRVWAKPAAQTQTSSAFQSACGNQPLCYDASDFAVAVVDLRMSVASGFKVMDATLRFVNKTAQPIILGYVDGSAVALDDQGNRYGPYNNRGLAGIGLVSGMSADPKFVIQPGGGSDARFELLWRPGQQDAIGSTFQLDMTIRGINTLVGGQHTLGAEVPLRFQGLANGMTGAGLASSGAGAPAPGVVGAPSVATTDAAAGPAMFANGGAATAAAPVCGPNGSGSGAVNAVAGAANSVGGQQAANATSTASNAAAALSSLKSIFGKKNAAANNAAATAPGGSPCVPAAVASPTAASAAPIATTTPAPTAAVSAGTNPAGAATAATAPVAGTAKSGTTPVATAIRAVKPVVNTPAGQAPAATTAKPSTAPAAAKPATQPATSTTKKAAPATNQNKANTPADPNKPSQR